MTERAHESFVRWQGRTVDQISFVSNLVFGLSTGGVGLLTSALLDGKAPAEGPGRGVFLSALFLQLAATLIGVGLAWNRLLDFRKTMAVVKARRGGALSEVKALQTQSRLLGVVTWRLLMAQTISFILGVLLIVALAVWRS